MMSTKLACHEVWIKINNSNPYMERCRQRMTLHDLFESHMPGPMYIHYVIKHDGSILDHNTLIPGGTSYNSPLHLITELYVMVKLNNKSTRYICERPYDTVLDFISRYPLAGKGAPGETVVTYKEQIINVEERICNLEETSVEYPLFIYLKFEIKCTLKFLKGTVDRVINVATTSNIDNLITNILRDQSLSSIEHGSILVEHKGQKIQNSDPLIHFVFALEEPFCISYIGCEDEAFKIMRENVKPASLYGDIGSSLYLRGNRVMEFVHSPLFNHRNMMNGNDVTLYYPPFEEFSKNCETISLDKDDCRFVNAICQSMSGVFHYEKDRIQIFNEMLDKYLGEHIKVGYDGVQVDGCILPGPCVIIEAKVEVGKGNADSYTEANSYYIQTRSKKTKKSKSCQPAFIIELVGPHMFISGAVMAKKVYVDRLTMPVWLVLQPMNNGAMEHIARVFKSFKVAISQLKNHYNTVAIDQPQYPVFQSYQDESGSTKLIQYYDEIRPHIFRATVDGRKVIVKFAQSYGDVVHKELAKNGFAPELFYCKKFEPTRFYVVVMEDMLDYKEIDDFVSECSTQVVDKILIQCKKALEVIHKLNYCHGDFRTPNILVHNETVCVIDFDWAGISGQVNYPFFMNHEHIQWPQDAVGGMPILANHDEYWMHIIEEKFKK